MTNTNKKKQEEKKIGFNPIAAAVAGAVVGAGVAVAGAVAMSDKKNRDNVKQALKNVKNNAMAYAGDMQLQAEKKKDEVGEKLAEAKKK